jgi:predicted phosphodiesterase
VKAGCILHGQYITLGDHFSLEWKELMPDSHIYTIGMTTNAIDCTWVPTVQINYANAADKQTLAFKESYVYDTMMETTDKPLTDPRVRYYRKSYIFYVMNSQLKDAVNWAIMNGDIVHTGPTLFPTTALSSDPNQYNFVVGDMDSSNSARPTLDKINSFARNEFDLHIHLGDFAYNTTHFGGIRGDDFFSYIAKGTVKVPYIICPGNHEIFEEGEMLNYKFRMPNTNHAANKSHLYDFVYKGVYYIHVNFDKMIWFDQTIEGYNGIFQWLQSRMELLKKRTDIKWRLFFSHRPFYCSDESQHYCVPMPFTFKRFEDLLRKNGFEIFLNGHVHVYQTSLPQKDLKICDPSMIGKGCSVQMIVGHSGTKWKYSELENGPDGTFPSLWISPLFKSTNFEKATYGTMFFTESMMHHELIESVTGISVFNYDIKKVMPTPAAPTYDSTYAGVFVIGGIAIIGALALVAIIMMKRAPVPTPTADVKDENFKHTKLETHPNEGEASKMKTGNHKA